VTGISDSTSQNKLHFTAALFVPPDLTVGSGVAHAEMWESYYIGALTTDVVTVTWSAGVVNALIQAVAVAGTAGAGTTSGCSQDPTAPSYVSITASSATPSTTQSISNQHDFVWAYGYFPSGSIAFAASSALILNTAGSQAGTGAVPSGGCCYLNNGLFYLSTNGGPLASQPTSITFAGSLATTPGYLFLGALTADTGGGGGGGAHKRLLMGVGQ